MYGSLPVHLRVLRAERGLKLRDVEDISGVAKETLSALERGERRAMDSTLAKLAQIYHVPLAELIEARDAMGKGKAPDSGREVWERLQRHDAMRTYQRYHRQDMHDALSRFFERHGGRKLDPDEHEELDKLIEEYE